MPALKSITLLVVLAAVVPPTHEIVQQLLHTVSGIESELLELVLVLGQVVDRIKALLPCVPRGQVGCLLDAA